MPPVYQLGVARGCACARTQNKATQRGHSYLPRSARSALCPLGPWRWLRPLHPCKPQPRQPHGWSLADASEDGRFPAVESSVSPTTEAAVDLSHRPAAPGDQPGARAPKAPAAAVEPPAPRAPTGTARPRCLADALPPARAPLRTSVRALLEPAPRPSPAP